MWRNAIVIVACLFAFPALAQDALDGVFASDPAVCGEADASDLSNALFEYDALALWPRHGMLANEFYCNFLQVLDASQSNGTELVAIAQCHQLEEHYADMISISAVSIIADIARGDGAVGDAIEISSSYLTNLLGAHHSSLYYRCPNLSTEEFPL